MADRMCKKIGDASLEGVAYAIEEYTSGKAFDDAAAWECILEVERMCTEARKIVDGIQRGLISRADCGEFCEPDGEADSDG
jgi:hypothetical protein